MSPAAAAAAAAAVGARSAAAAGPEAATSRQALTLAPSDFVLLALLALVFVWVLPTWAVRKFRRRRAD